MSSRQHPKKAGGSEDPGISKDPVNQIYPLPTQNELSTNNTDETLLEYNVEGITGKRYVDGQVQMKVKWEGFSPENSTWEPLENLKNCIQLVAEFEAKLFEMEKRAKRISCMKEKKDKKPSAVKVLPSPEPGERQLETGKKTGSKSNAEQLSTSNSNEEASIAEDPKENIPIKLLPALNLALSDEDTPSCLFANGSNTTSADQELSARASSPSGFLESTISGSGSGSQPLSVLSTSNDNIRANPLKSRKKRSPQWQANKKKAKAVSKKKQKSSNSETLENLIEKTAKDINSMQIGEKRPKVQGSQKSKKIVKKIEKPESSDDDSEVPSMTPCQTVFGLARGLELDKVEHSFKVGNRHFLFVSWKGIDAVDTVPMDELKDTYPAQVLKYFEKMDRRY